MGNAGNIIAGNSGDGIYVFGASAQEVIVSRNMIGANRDTAAFPNGGSGIHMKYSLSKIVAKENVIAANGGDGVRIERNVVYFLDTTRPPIYQRPSDISITDNCIGCVRQGDTTGAHGGSGIFILNADSILIDRNRIFGTAKDGITVDDSTRMVTIVRNTIGPETSSITSQLIGRDGVHVSNAVEVWVGDPVLSSYSNTINFCKGYGLTAIDSAQDVFAFDNSMIDNALGGIALDDLSTYFDKGNFNDALDADHGSNDLQNTLEQTLGSTNPPRVHLSGSFKGTPNTPYIVDVYLGKSLPSGEEVNLCLRERNIGLREASISISLRL
jgi:hypothetical protein